MKMSLTSEEKKRFLKALEEDEEFKYAVGGLLGYKEILDRISSLEERQMRLEEEMKDTRRILTTIAYRFGIISESSFREGMKYVVEEVLGTAKVSRLTMKDEEGLVYGHPSEVEVDVLVRDDQHIIIEVKSRVSKGDVAELYRIGLLYRKRHGIKPRLLIIGAFIDKIAKKLARELGVEIRPIVED